MHPSIRTVVLTLATLAIGGTDGLKLKKRADPVDTSETQGVQNILITDASQNWFYTPMHFGSGDGAVSIFGLVSTTRGDIILPSAYTKDLTGFVTQGKSVAEGPIYAGPVSAGGWTVPDQDIIYYENHDVPLPIPADGGYAYAGFGIWPNTSTIAQAFGDWSADSLVARILAEEGAEPYWTLLINPLEDDKGTDQSFGGVLTIGEVVNLSQVFNISAEKLKEDGVPDLTQIASYPVLNNKGVYDGVSYYAVIDSISWGNYSATLKSTVPGTPEGKISAYLDSTNTWIYAPYHITEELYKNLEDSSYSKDTGLWHVKCTELTITITIAGHAYPISPLTALRHLDSYNCVGSFRAKPDNVGGDIALGVPFLKNVYARFAYETRRDGEVYDPFVQIMPVTDVEDAHHDWEVWYEKWGSSSPHPSSSVSDSVHPSPTYSSVPPSDSPPHSTPTHTSSPASDPQATDGSNPLSGAVEDDDDEDEIQGGAKKSGKSTTKKAGSFLAAIVVGVIVVCLLIIGCIVFCVMRKRKGRDGKGSYRGLGKPDDDVGPMKVPLYDSEGGSGRYGEGGQGRYTDPYKDS